MQFLPAGATGQTSNSHCDHEIRSTWGSIRKHGLRDNQEIVNWAAESEALIGMIGVYFMLIFSGIWKLYIHEKQVCMYIVCTICYTYQTSSNKSFCMGEMTAKYRVWKCNVSDKLKPQITLIWLTYLPHINSSKLFTAQNMLSTIRTCVAVFPW